MKKSDLIKEIAQSAGISKAAAERSLKATTILISKALKNGESVTLVGFGTFYVGKRAPRSGRNPRTGQSIKIKATNSPKFRAGRSLKEELNPELVYHSADDLGYLQGPEGGTDSTGPKKTR